MMTGICNGRSQRGFSLLEMIVVLLVVSILLGIAFPSFMQWRQSVQYRTLAREVAAALRYAQSSSVMNNRQYRVQFLAPLFDRYRVQQADRFVAGGWATALEWADVPQGIILQPDNLTITSSIEFSPNGTAFNGTAGTRTTIAIFSTTATPTRRFDVRVENTGKISVVSRTTGT
jgi:prepilin-type N-terminal cleavage/methylation domain-containing protein